MDGGVDDVGGGPENLPLELLLPRAASALTRCRQAAAAAHGLTATAVSMLVVLARSDGLSHRELAGRLGLTPATLTPVLDGLVAVGAVQRLRDHGDRRVVRVHITDDGRELVRAADGAVRRDLAGRLPRPSAPDEAVVRRYLLTVLAVATGDGS